MAKLDTRAIGLDVGLKAIKFLTGKENLHYGYWEGLEVCAANVGAAQEAYTKKLFAMLPKRKELKILDIGGGAGETARKLSELGHSVEIVVPSPFLAGRCRENCGSSVIVNEMKFEDFQSDAKFDICLFSESFQYIPMEISLPKAVSLLNEKGRILIGDCFRTQAYYSKSRPSRVGGGFAFSKYEKIIADLEFSVEHFEDITHQAAPSVQVEQDFFNVIGYGVTRFSEELDAKKPFLNRIVAGLFSTILGKKRSAKLLRRLQGDDRNAENFSLLNRYILTRLKPKT